MTFKADVQCLECGYHFTASERQEGFPFALTCPQCQETNTTYTPDEWNKRASLTEAFIQKQNINRIQNDA